MIDKEKSLAQLHAALGMKRLNRTWAKLEIVIGLASAGLGMRLGLHDPELLHAMSGLALFVLGGYLALAGHRSLLYQSNNELTAYLAEGQGRE